MPEVSVHVLKSLSAEARAKLLTRVEGDLGPFMEKAAPIIEAVRTEGDAALARFAQQFDKSPVTEDAIAATPADFDAAFDSVEREMIDVLEMAVDNVRRFHEAQMPTEMWMKEMAPGIHCGERSSPIPSVACYVPRGKGSFPSVVNMTAVPAVVAGVPLPIIVTPPGPDGKVDAATLVAARLAGVERVFKCGGAQAVAAVAYGTQTVPKCVKFVGPGSPWVIAAKRLLSGMIDPGPPAGPSESIVLADETANGRVAALDLLNESEHGPDSSAYLVTNSQRVADEVLAAIPGYWAHMGDERTGYSQAVLCGARGGIVVCETMEDAIAFTNDYAPEHLQVHSKSPYDYLGALKNAGEILLGEHSAICLGNYALGPNAVLPTNATAMTRSPLGVHDYLKLTSIAHVTKKGYDSLAPQVRRFAEYEGFEAHANAVSPLREKAFNGE
ncbi:histidinol dehydrogenase [Acuticoccus sp. MNP-M23]|uniref:histidinol dehydrogenase n=1 Tax=Acuticoccus sp. MNP-M23 TaxID=3072793 RepID=UPI00281499E2|nr:histidinol dehydrogenase [Acuticoccus sp. MNP-M23]WMS43709.1 histidinol dehydrogenase [Acuticoccus sp. MNP-M23]